MFFYWFWFFCMIKLYKQNLIIKSNQKSSLKSHILNLFNNHANSITKSHSSLGKKTSLSRYFDNLVNALKSRKFWYLSTQDLPYLLLNLLVCLIYSNGIPFHIQTRRVCLPRRIIMQYRRDVSHRRIYTFGSSQKYCIHFWFGLRQT